MECVCVTVGGGLSACGSVDGWVEWVHVHVGGWSVCMWVGGVCMCDHG